MATSLHNFTRSPNSSTRSFDSSSVASSSAASPRLLPAHGRISGSGGSFFGISGTPGTGATSTRSSLSLSLSDGRPPTRGFTGTRPSFGSFGSSFGPSGSFSGPTFSQNQSQPVGVLPSGVASRLPSLHEHEHGGHDHGSDHDHDNGHNDHDTPFGYRQNSVHSNHGYPLYGHEHEHSYEHHHHHSHNPRVYPHSHSHPYSYSHSHPYSNSSMGRGDSLPPTDSLASTPGPGYIALPPLHHDGGGGGGGAPPSHQPPPSHPGHPAHPSHPSTAQHPLPPSAPYGSHQQHQHQLQQQQHQQHQQQHAAKRAYRQRRKDPSCDACRERKVKCDATETTSCSECSNRQVKCQFTKETNRRMSSIKQMQDLERQLDRLRRENGGLRRILQESRAEGAGGVSGAASGSSGSGSGPGFGGPAGSLPKREGTDGPGRLDTDTDTPMADNSAMEDDDYYGQPRQVHHHQSHHHRLSRHQLPLLPIPEIGSNPPRRHRRTILFPPTTARHPPSAYPSSSSSAFAGSSTPQPLFDLGRARTNLRAFARGLWTPPATAQSQSQTSAQLTNVNLPELPPRDVVDTLLQAYYNSVHTMLPVIHWPTFQRQVDELYRNGPNPSPETPASFVALFFSVLAVGGLFSTYFAGSTAPSFTAVHLAEAARSLIDPWTMTTSSSSASSASNIDDVRTLLLLSIFLNESNLKSAAWTWLSSAVRIAQSMALYMEPADRSLESEMRRRVWWALYVVDRALALDLGNRPVLVQDEDCDVALPADDGTGELSAQPQTMLAVLDVVRSYTALGKLLSAASSLPSSSSLSGPVGTGDIPSSPLSTPSPSSSFAVPAASSSSSSGSGTHIPSTHLATFDQHFVACMRVFPPACDPSAVHHYPEAQQQPALSLQLLNPLVYLLHARLVLHRHNLAPYSSSRHHSHQTQHQHQQARLTAVEQCTHTALETATLVRRTGLGDGVEQPTEQAVTLAAGATSLLTTHLLRCTLFLLLTGHADAAALLVRALSAISVVHRDVAIPCGRFLAFFMSSLSFKRAEYTTYLARATPQTPQGPGPQGQPGSSVPTPTQSAPPTTSPQSLYDALVRDEELLVYVSADLQSSPESSWVWEGETATADASTDVPTSSSGNALNRPETRMGLSDDESRDWGGWARLEDRVRSLAALPAQVQTQTVPAAVPTGAAPSSAAGPPPPTSYSTTSTATGTTSPVAHYTHQPMSMSMSASMSGSMSGSMPSMQMPPMATTPSTATSTLPPLLPGPRPQFPPPQIGMNMNAPSGSAAAPRRVDSPVASGPSGSGPSGGSSSGPGTTAGNKPKNQDRISIANII